VLPAVRTDSGGEGRSTWMKRRRASRSGCQDLQPIDRRTGAQTCRRARSVRPRRH
jgi:hypothetical protein